MTRSLFPHWREAPREYADAYSLLQAFAQQSGRPSALLAMHAAVVERLRPDIVALLRVNFLPEHSRLDPALDANLLFGPLCEPLGDDYFTMNALVRRLCLIALNAWGARQGEQEERTSRVGHFVRYYVHWARKMHHKRTDPVFADYLNLLDWVALGFADPEYLARKIGEDIYTSTHAGDRAAASIRFGPIAAVLELPLTTLMDGFIYARAMDALTDKNTQKAQALMACIADRDIEIGGLRLPPPASVLADFQQHIDIDRLTPKKIACLPLTIRHW